MRRARSSRCISPAIGGYLAPPAHPPMWLPGGALALIDHDGFEGVSQLTPASKGVSDLWPGLSRHCANAAFRISVGSLRSRRGPLQWR